LSLPRLRSWQLFAVCVLVWGTTWHAITHQIDTVAAELAVAVRFALAGGAVVLVAAWRGDRLRFALRHHALLALQGVFLYGVSYVCVYHAERHVPSGLVAVGYSASPLLTGLGGALLFGVAVSRRFVAGGLLGLAGVALIFWPEFDKAAAAPQVSAALGAFFTIAAVLLSAIGSLAASRNRAHGVPLWPAIGYGMLYGAASAALAALALGRPLALPHAAPWWAALLYLALAGSVLTFACYLTLQERFGPGPASAVGVMTPLLALAVSLLLEGYRPAIATAAGAALALAGNAMMLSRPAPAAG
jgi:drug/metabolite transporter (DMT)-like permease